LCNSLAWLRARSPRSFLAHSESAAAPRPDCSYSSKADSDGWCHAT
jgi:hypothetical protein